MLSPVDEEARSGHREALWLRQLLTRVAEHLEHLGARDRDLGRLLAPVAQRIRKRLHEGVPRAWKPEATHRPAATRPARRKRGYAPEP
jgi:hypothetical protein